MGIWIEQPVHCDFARNRTVHRVRTRWSSDRSALILFWCCCQSFFYWKVVINRGIKKCTGVMIWKKFQMYSLHAITVMYSFIQATLCSSKSMWWPLWKGWIEVGVLYLLIIAELQRGICWPEIISSCPSKSEHDEPRLAPIISLFKKHTRLFSSKPLHKIDLSFRNFVAFMAMSYFLYVNYRTMIQLLDSTWRS